MTMDWSLGRYEHTAAQLLPAARVVVDVAAPSPGERLVDVGCGTGNAALLAAASGATVTGVDPAPRLLEVARAEVAARGLDVTFLEGEAASLPLEDGSVDVAMSVFGVIFAPDAAAAAAELARVCAPRARVVLTAWIPEGAVREAVQASREALGAPPGPPPFAWHDRESLAGLLGPHGFEVELSEHELAFRAASAEDYVAGELENHPMWVAGRMQLEARGGMAELRERVVGILSAGNEDPDGFRVTSRYVAAVARRDRV